MLIWIIATLPSLLLSAVTGIAPVQDDEPQDAKPAATAPAAQPEVSAPPALDQAEDLADAAPGDALPAHLDALLDRLEASAEGLTGFTAKIAYEKYDELLGRPEVRSGEILYRVDATNDDRGFAVLFDRLIVGRRRQERQKHFIFDGRWLAEIDHEAKQFIKRELVAPGKKFDPLKLGKGPIPLPIGQKKADVLAKFDVADAVLPVEGRLTRLDAALVDGLRLIPRPHTSEAREFVSIDLFYDRETDLPVGILAIEPNGNSKTVLLTEVVRNPDFDDVQQAKLDISDPDPQQWQIDIQPWRGGG